MPSGAATRTLDEAGDIRRYIILQAAAPGGPIRGGLELQIMMYMLVDWQEHLMDKAGYRASELGPYSDVVAGELGRLVQAGILSNDGGISLTPEGREAAAGLAEGEDPDMLQFFRRHQEYVGRMSRDELLTYVYCAYPGMAVKSAEYRRLWPGRERTVLSLIDAGKITSGVGSELLGIHYEDMRDMMAENGTLRLYYDENDHL